MQVGLKSIIVDSRRQPLYNQRMARNPQKGYRFDPETVRFIEELREIVSEELAGAHVSQVMVVTMAIRSEYFRRKDLAIPCGRHDGG